MEDSTEDLEPLFDYRRVQPAIISLEDDSDASPSVSPKRRKISKPTNDKKEDNNAKERKTVEVVDCEDEEDWLPSPPKVPAPAYKLKEDSTIRELRLKRQELASLARSAEDALRAVDEAATRSLNTFSDVYSEQDTEEPSKASADRAKIVISIQDKKGTKQYRVFADESFEQLFKKYAEKANIDVQNLVFCFDGDKINPSSTPQGLGMEDDDLIEVHVKEEDGEEGYLVQRVGRSAGDAEDDSDMEPGNDEGEGEGEEVEDDDDDLGEGQVMAPSSSQPKRKRDDADVDDEDDDDDGGRPSSKKHP